MMFARADTYAPSPAIPMPSISSANFRYPTWVSRDGIELWSWSQTFLWRSLNDGATWDTVRTFDHGVSGVQQYVGGPYDGELLVTINPGLSVKGTLWRSVGYSRATGIADSWAMLLETSTAGAYFSGDWNLWVEDGGEIVLAGEYGTKGTPNARYVWRSTDGGDTFTPIFDWSGEGKHVHGVSYDRWWDRVWAVFGDAPHRGIAYTDNWRDPSPTWTWVSTTIQPVGILPMPDAVCFGSDDGANGVYSLPRAANSREAVPSVLRSPAFRVNTATTLQVITSQMFWRGEGFPALFGFAGVPGVAAAGEVLASWDGLVFHRLFRDTVAVSGGGVFRAVGPTAAGNIVGMLSDGRQSSASRLVLPAPSWQPTAW